MSKWEKVKLGTKAKIRRGASPRPIDDPKYFGGSVGWVRISDVTSSKKYLNQTTQYVSELGERLSVRVNPGDFIVSICGTVGKPVIINIPACIHDGFVLIFDMKNINVEYLYYFFQSIQENIRSFGQPGTQTNLNTTIIENIELPFPPLTIQTRIAEILSTADKAIENSEKLIAKYKRMKTGMMQDLLTKGIDENGNIRSEATHKFKDSHLGRIPVEWEVGTTLNNLYMKGRIGWQGLKSSEFLEEGNYLITGIHFNSNNRVDWNQCYRVSEFRYLQDPDIQVKEDDLLLTKDGTIGKLAYIDYLPGKATLNSHLLVLRPLTDKINPKFLFYQLLSERFKIFINNIKSGSTLAGLTQSNFGKYLLTIPQIAEQERIQEALNQIFNSLENEIQTLLKLKRLKTGLMNDMLSGKVEIEGVEEVL